MDPATGNVGSYSTATLGISNAFLIPATMYNSSTGLAYSTTPTVGAVVPQAQIYTLANILAGCVNSTGSSAYGCSQLFTYTTIGSSAPTNTLTAILSIALHPGNNVSPLCTNNAGISAPFQTALSCSTSPPNDFTLALGYNSGATAPAGLAVDSSLKLWIADYNSGGSASRFLRFNTYNGAAYGGSPISNSGTSSVQGMAIDASGNVWGINRTSNTVVKFNAGGSSPTAGISVGSSPRAIAFDLSNNAWVTNGSGNSVSVLSNSGSVIATSSSGLGGLNSPRDIAIDSNGKAWVADHSGSLGSGGLSAFTLSGSTVTAASTTAYTGGGLITSKSIAIDSSNNVWVGGDGSTVISEFNNSGTPVSTNGYLDPTASPTGGIAFDGSGNLWSADQVGALIEFSSTGSVLTPSTGYTGGAGYSAVPLNGLPNAIAIDQSGSIWVTTSSPTVINGVSVNLVQFVGLATPVIQPIALALQNGKLNQRPGTPTPIVINSSTLPYYTQGTAYSAQLEASGGNTGLYTWTVASGSLPSGMTLSTSGLISGSSSASGTASFTVQATDSTYSYNYVTKAFTLSAATSLPAGTNNSALNGTYAIQISGLKGGTVSTSGAVSGFGALGSLTFNGSGSITSGTMDFNGASTSTSQQVSVTGTYTVGSDNRGTMLLSGSPSGLLPMQLTFSLGNFSSSIAQNIAIMEFDYTGTGTTLGIADGIGKLQTASAFTSGTIGQTFVFGMDGETPCSTCSGTVSPYGSVSAAGRFVNSGGNTSGEEDTAAISISYPGIPLSGSYSPPSGTTGRGTITLTPSGTNFPAAPTDYVYYIVNSGELLLLSSDAHTSTSLLIGDALVQSGSFSTASASGNYVAYEGSPTNGNGSSAFPNAMNLNLISLVFNGSGTITSLLLDNSNNGTVSLETIPTPSAPYSVDANGRMLLAGGVANLPIFYLAGTSGGFGTEQPASGSTPGLLRLEQQTASGPFTCSSISNGAYSFGTGRTVTAAGTTTGVITLTSGSGSGTADNSDPSGVLTSGSSTTVTCSTDSYTSTLGRLKFTNSANQPSAGYIISGSRAVIMDATSGKTTPSLTILQK
jgi:sugar lactone lactonase YvrE